MREGDRFVCFLTLRKAGRWYSRRSDGVRYEPLVGEVGLHFSFGSGPAGGGADEKTGSLSSSFGGMTTRSSTVDESWVSAAGGSLVLVLFQDVWTVSPARVKLASSCASLSS